MEKTKKIWLLYDGRYRTDEDEAVCYEMCETLKEAKKSANDYGDDTVIVEAETVGTEIINEKIIN